MDVVGLGGIHGALVIGMHGCGVSTPIAAVVAAATCGLDGLLHMPNGGMLTSGALSWMVAAGLPPMSVVGRMTLRVAGAMPKVHMSIAPVVTFGGMTVLLRPSAVPERWRCYLREPLTDAVKVPPVVVMKQRIVRSSSCSQLRAEGSR